MVRKGKVAPHQSAAPVSLPSAVVTVWSIWLSLASLVTMISDVLDGARFLLVGSVTCVGSLIVCAHPFTRFIELRQDSEMCIPLSSPLTVVSQALVRFYSCCLLTVALQVSVLGNVLYPGKERMHSFGSVWQMQHGGYTLLRNHKAFPLASVNVCRQVNMDCLAAF